MCYTRFVRALLAIPLLAGVLFPPVVSAQIRIGPRSFGMAPPRVSGNVVPRFSLPAPVRNFGATPLVHPFPGTTSTQGITPSPLGAFGSIFDHGFNRGPNRGFGHDFDHGFGRRRSPNGGYLFVNPFSFGYPYAAPFAYPYGEYALAFYPSLWPPLDEEYLQASRIAHGDVAGEVASQKNELLANQVQELSQEVASLRQESASQPPPAAPAPAPAAAPTKSIPTAFVYQDGRVIEARNYAIFGKTLWIFGAETTRKIPLSDLNLPATQKLNEEHGIDVTLPGSQ